jgi:trans-L-3-hydroxyproline dehydratase
MRPTRFLTTVEMHTGGEPFRIVTGGMPPIRGETILEKRAWLERDADEFRRALMLEPRGHADMYGGFVTEPISPGADLGVVFTQNADYSPHCGHGIIGLATAAVELGWVDRMTPETRVGIDAPCGFIEAFVEWDGTHAADVRFVNVPSFVWQLDVTVTTPTFGAITGDIAYGGAFYFYVDGAAVGLDIRESELRRLVDLGTELKDAANAALSVVHPEIPEIRGVYGTIIAGAPRHATSTQANVCIFANREVDRSPTGSGTAGRIAQLHARGRFQAGDVLRNESIIGSVFEGWILHEVALAGQPAVIPEIRGNAFICGFGNWMIDERDPLGYGFQVTDAGGSR